MKKFILTIAAAVCSHLLHAQGVGINTLKPDPSAALDIVSDNKGLLIPRVELKSLTDGKTINKPAHSLLVYNVNSSLNGGIGYYYNAGSSSTPQWKRFCDNPVTDPPQVAFAAHGWLPGQTVGNLETKRVLFQTESYDLGNNYDDTGNASGSIFIAPLKGIYHFDVKTTIYWSEQPVYKIVYWHNGSANIFRTFNGSRLETSFDIPLEVGDQLYIELTNAYPGPGGTLSMDPSNCEAHINGRLAIKL